MKTATIATELLTSSQFQVEVPPEIKLETQTIPTTTILSESIVQISLQTQIDLYSQMERENEKRTKEFELQITDLNNQIQDLTDSLEMVTLDKEQLTIENELLQETISSNNFTETTNTRTDLLTENTKLREALKLLNNSNKIEIETLKQSNKQLTEQLIDFTAITHEHVALKAVNNANLLKIKELQETIDENDSNEYETMIEKLMEKNVILEQKHTELRTLNEEWEMSNELLEELDSNQRQVCVCLFVCVCGFVTVCGLLCLNVSFTILLSYYYFPFDCLFVY